MSSICFFNNLNSIVRLAYFTYLPLFIFICSCDSGVNKCSSKPNNVKIENDYDKYKKEAVCICQVIQFVEQDNGHKINNHKANNKEDV